MAGQFIELKQLCAQVLSDNWRTTHTIPADGPYPHQWLWDSGFNAIGWSHINMDKAQRELKHLMTGQWANGMLPHMIFAKGNRDKYFWQSHRSPFAPETVDTSGMTQPPVIAEAVVKIGEKMKLHERRQWYLDMYPALLKYHTWLFMERNRNDGLITLIHPWESGFDSNPAWIEQLHTSAMPWWSKFLNNKFGHAIIHQFRNDRRFPPGQRLDDIDAAVYQKELRRLRNMSWDSDKIMTKSKLLVEDLAFNCIFIRANDRLAEIAKTIGHELPKELDDQMHNLRGSLELLWDTGHTEYFSRNAITESLIKQPSLMGLMPLYAGSISKERARELVAKLHDVHKFKCAYPIPTVPLDSSYFKEKSYWQGPTWINTNWMIADGLSRYGFTEEARTILDASIALVEQSGPYEYFSAISGEPAGAEKFSWTAALTIDIIEQLHSN